MFKNLLLTIFCLMMVFGCSFFGNSSKREPIQKVDTIVDFNTIDAFPLFPNCQDIPSREKQQICFQMEMSKYIYAVLKEYPLNAAEVINDTVFVKLKVNYLGKTSLSRIRISDKTKKLLPELDSLIKVSVESIPNLEPAIKRAIPVTTEYTLPIVLKNKN